MTICGACNKYCSDLNNINKGICELHEKEVGFSDDFDCNDFTIDYNIEAFLIKQAENGILKPNVIYFKV